MKKIVFSSEMCYSDRVKMKATFKFVATCSLSIFCATAVVVGTTVAVVHNNNTTGQGGLDTAGIIDAQDELRALATPQDDLKEYFEANVPETVTDEAEDRELSYQSYRVKSGDMISVIAQKYGVTQDTIISVNNIRSSRTIQPGQYLKIPSIPGILYTVKNDGETLESIAGKYDVDVEKCSLANNIESSQSLSSGRTVFVPDAAMDWVTRQEINGDLFTIPLHSSYYLTSLFGYRVNPFDSSKRTYHGGIDMACPKGTPIYAALEGKVITAGWSNVYGNYVIVEHHSGYRTLYGHMSKILVTKGNHVYTNTKIGLVGSTGQSTGPHLHFTVYKNGHSINPMNVLPIHR